MPQPRRALIVVDVQNDYAGGALPIEYPAVENSLGNIGKVMDAARGAAIPVVVVQNILASNAPFMAEGSSGVAFHEVIASRKHDHYVAKKLPSAFSGTDLEKWLRQHAIDTVTVIGYMTHNCNLSTMLHAFHGGFSVEFVSDASGSVPYENRAGRATAEEIHRVISVVLQSRFAAVMSTAEWIEMLQRGATPQRDSIFLSNRRARGLAAPAFPDGAVQLRFFMAKDEAAIEKWPAYPPEFEELDYALRKDGWIAEFRDQPDSRLYAAEQSGELIAFTLLSLSAQGEAEFRIALRADKIGQGLGRIIAGKTLEIGFDEIGLKRIHLVVRKNNPRAIKLYQQKSFSHCGECRMTINNMATDFLVMELLRKDFIRSTNSSPG